MGYTNLVKTWRDNPDDYIVIYNTLQISGEEKIVYHIYNTRKGLSYLIEKQSLVRALAQEMIDSGVKLVNMDEARKIIRPNRP